MKLQFKKQEFQDDAVRAVIDLFDGQVNAPSSFSVAKIDLGEMSVDGELVGYGNALRIGREQIQRNMQAVQTRNDLPLTVLDELRFNIEMETGTGKTFVYTKTIYELNKVYGFKKFVILVPSRAIREGTNSSLGLTQDYFAREYDGKRLEYFVYDSKKLNQVRNFALSPNLSVMITTIDAINKNTNLFTRETEKMDKPARDYVADCRPIVIIDEPQSTDNTDLQRQAITMLNPLFELRYSATPKKKINTLYRLTPVDAYQMGIVKQICVANDHIDDDFNKPYIRLLEVGNDGRFYARLEIDVRKPDGTLQRKPVKVYNTTKLMQAAGGAEKYDGYIVTNMSSDEDNCFIEFTNTQVIYKGQAIGAVDELSLTKSQIRRTIEAHFDKELKLLSQNIKVLSLFFIDEVARYRGDDGRGIYAVMFDEAYAELIEQPKYAALKAKFGADPARVHDGYFSKDKKGKVKDTSGESEDDESTYKAIMVDKIKLLNFEENGGSPLRFIWSHSALKEGWDNPNVFQICTLIESRTEFTARQKIGRGLRLCVNQSGERIDDRKINVLTVIARETFAEFAANLQADIERETGVKFGILTEGMFIGIAYKDESGMDTTFTEESTKALMTHFRERRYIDASGAIKDTLKNDLKNDTLDLPARFENARERLVKLLKESDRRVEVRQTKERVAVKRKVDFEYDERFIELWERLRYKSYYRLNTDISDMTRRILKDIREMEEIPKLAVVKETAKIAIEASGVSATKTGETVDRTLSVGTLPDVIRLLSEGTGMPRASIGEILYNSGRLQDFINNPQKFVEAVQKIIDYHERTMSIEGIIYTKIDGQEYSLAQVFGDAEDDEVMAYLSNTVTSDKSLYNRVIWDSEIERSFAADLERDPNVEFFFKIPKKAGSKGFYISTPVGDYSPDWAVYYAVGDEKKLYFVIETKGSLDRAQLKGVEDIKIHCGEQHFKGAGADISWRLAKTWQGVNKR